MKRIAVTGGIACGKSTVGKLMKSLGVAVCDADQMAHDLYEPDGPVYEAVIAAFGPGILDEAGRIDRERLGTLVFSEREQLAKLNRIVHPWVHIKLQNWLQAQLQRECRMAAAVVPLLFEAGMEEGWDCVICVACRQQVQDQRLQARGLDAHAIAQRKAAQWPQEKKMELSDEVIWNEGTLEALEQSVKKVLETVERNK